MIETFENLQKDFLKRSKEISNTKLFLETELKEIDKFLNHKSHQISRGSSIGFLQSTYMPQIETIGNIYYKVRSAWSTFLEPFNEYYYNETEMPYKPIESMVGNTQEEVDEANKRIKPYHVQGIEFAKYYLWLKEKDSKTVLKIKKQKGITLNQKMLLLYYLGFDPNKHKKTETSELLFLILGLEKDKENLRKSLSKLVAGKNNVRTQKNLQFVKQLFEKHNLTDISNRVQKDLDELK